ncbi:MAG: family 10 glycosylhydrolase [Muribaculaceae bacterium]|nr:family 10 glycosylhydrolase [Muribaculaceae bacterium]
MIKRLKYLSVAALMLATSAVSMSSANPKREFRSTWLTTVSNIDWPSTKGTSASAQAAQKKELLAYLDKFEEWNMTGTCLHVRTMADALYPSEYAPWSSFVSGQRGVSPGWDPLAYFVEECHKRGLEAYVWLNPYRWATTTQWSTEMDKEWLEKDMIISNDAGDFYTFNPALPETSELFINVIKELVNNYAIDGLLFDDYFYPGGGTTESSSAPDYDDYKASGTTLSIGDWRRANVNKMVKDCYETIKSIRPDVRFGIGPAGVSNKSASKYGLPSQSSYGTSASDWQYAQIYADPLTWMYEGTIDFIAPQLYWETTHSTNAYGGLTHWWSDVAEILNCHCYISQASYKVNNSGWGVDEIIDQVKINRQYAKNNNCGAIFYNSNTLVDYCSSLADDVYSTPTLTPEITWKSGPTYGKVADLKYNNGTLSWTETTNGKAIIRYTVYAVPMSVTIDGAKSADGDGFDVKYLQKVVYGGSYTLATDKQSNYWYAVSVFDGYGKEHEAAIVNYPEGESESATLVYPVDDAIVAWTPTFEWSAVENATYIVEIASDSQFRNIVYTQNNVTTNSIAVDLGQLESETGYYWRVRTSQSGKLEAVSDVETFKTSARPVAPATTLMTPENGSDHEEDFTFTWSEVECEEYVLEVSPSADFSTIKYTKTLTTTSHEMTISLLGKGTFYWRVTTRGKYLSPTISEVRSFNVTKLSIGSFEPGYSIKIDKDNDSYTSVDGVEVNSLWFRSVDDNYSNIIFGESGSYNRSFCVGNDYIYMTGRSENSSGANIYLRKFDQRTGEIVSDLILGDEGKVGYYPCNTVMKDDKGNICIANMTINASQNTIKVWLVDTETGALTQIANVSPSSNSSARIDHVSITGDAESGNFKLYTGIRNTTTVVRWTFENGRQSKEETCTLQSLYPSSAGNLGTAPRVLPISDTEMFVIGGETYLSRYTFATKGTMTDSFKNNQSLVPEGKEANGGTFFTLNGVKYIVYPYADHKTGHKFNLVKADANMSFSSMEKMWTLPVDGMGNIDSSTFQSDADYLTVDEGKVILYLFVVGNGLCAYEIVDTSASGISQVNDDVNIGVVGNLLNLGTKAEQVSVYDVSGAMIAAASDVTTMEMNLNKGVYIVKVVVDGTTIVKKIAIR